ncbi:ADP-ribosylglycohydrolase family protein [Bradyrhizobium genosp. L]|uniref:ADP-ribosylglycohydrolase family protein n=1 Tax=Bradyrhizobium genosp. L TaxID=83637 RepID=UPI0018A295E5|nr:ADP-ribosylglycohydrolase family protein [Bradyrhizobium genosp. L]QPF83637.1 ADP-ribosylglycohydrolase family protein [Bradyrhizobium genosp. L]
MEANSSSRFEAHVLACLAFGVIGDAMGTPTENLEPAEIEARFCWVDSFEGDGTDDTIMRDLIAFALIRTGGYADADHWAEEWRDRHSMIFGSKVGRFFPSVLHAAAKLRHGYLPRTVAAGTMPSSSAAMAIAPVGIVNAGNPRAAAVQAMEIASLLHVTDVAFCQDGAAAIAAAVAEALMPEATVGSVLAASTAHLKPWSGRDMLALIAAALELADQAADYRTFRERYHATFRQRIACDSRETVPAALAIVHLAKGDPRLAASLGANFGRDADTIACMAAGICGALSGVSPANAELIACLPVDSQGAQADLASRLVAITRAKMESELKAIARCPIKTS